MDEFLVLASQAAQGLPRVKCDRNFPASNLIRQQATEQQTATARATVRAECCEALVGAVYLAWGGAFATYCVKWLC